MQALMKAIVQMGIFMICSQVLIHFRPNGSYEKYMKLLVGVMVLAQIFFPVMNLFTGEDQSMEERVVWFEEMLQKSMKEAQAVSRETEGLLDQMTKEALRKQLDVTKEDAAQTESLTEQSKEAKQWEEKENTKEGIRIDKIHIDIGKAKKIEERSLT